MTDLCEREIYISIDKLRKQVRSLSFRVSAIRCVFKNSKFKEEKKRLKKLMTDLSNKFYKLAQQLEYNKNFDTAIELYQKSVELGNTDAMVALATFYIDREEFEKYNEALQLLRTAISKGSVAAKTALAYCYFDGIDGLLPKNLEKAIELFEQSTQSGDTQAILELCFIYSEKEESLQEVKRLRSDLETQYKNDSITIPKLQETTQLFFDFYVTHPEIENNFETAAKYMLLKLNLPNLAQKQKFEQSNNGQSR